MQNSEIFKKTLVEWLKEDNITNCEAYQLDIMLVEFGEDNKSTYDIRLEVYRDLLLGKLDFNDELNVSGKKYLNLIAFLLQLYRKDVQKIHDIHLGLVFTNHVYKELNHYVYNEEIECKFKKLIKMYHINNEMSDKIIKNISNVLVKQLINKYYQHKLDSQCIKNFVNSLPFELNNDIYPTYKKLITNT